MDQGTHNQYEKKLLILRSEIEEYLRKSEDSAAAVEPDKGLGRLSRMEAMQDQQMVLELRRRKKRQLLDVLNALKRIEQGNFGVCIFCGKGNFTRKTGSLSRGTNLRCLCLIVLKRNIQLASIFAFHNKLSFKKIN